jgi:hypothetical protein
MDHDAAAPAARHNTHGRWIDRPAISKTRILARHQRCWTHRDHALGGFIILK